MNYERCIYKNLASEMVKRDVTIEHFRITLNKKTTKCIKEKLSGKTKFSVAEAMLLFDTYFSDCEFTELFKKEKQNAD